MAGTLAWLYVVGDVWSASGVALNEVPLPSLCDALAPGYVPHVSCGPKAEKGDGSSKNLFRTGSRFGLHWLSLGGPGKRDHRLWGGPTRGLSAGDIDHGEVLGGSLFKYSVVACTVYFRGNYIFNL